jgi:VWFA-related protein
MVFGCGGGGGGSESGGSGGGGGGTTPAVQSPDISAPASVDFGVALLNLYSEREIVVRNTNNNPAIADLQIGQISLENPNSAFSIVGGATDGCSNDSVRSSSFCTVKIRLTPGAQIDYNDRLLIPSNDPDENPVAVALSGKGRNWNVTINEVQTDICPTLKLLVSVTDVNGAPQLNLPSTVFSILENGGTTPKTITKLTHPISSPISIVLVLDYSGSLPQTTRDQLEAAAKQFIDRLGDSDEAALIRFNEVICDNIPFVTTDAPGTGSLQAEIDEPYACGELGTALYDATYLAIENTAAFASRPRRAVIVLSDGADFNSTRTIDEVTNLAVLEGVPLFTVAFLETSTPKPEIMQQMAQETGGQFFEALTSAEVDAIYNAITTILSNQYLIEYPTSSTGGGTVSVDVLVDDGAGNQGEDSKDAIGCP